MHLSTLGMRAKQYSARALTIAIAQRAHYTSGRPDFHDRTMYIRGTRDARATTRPAEHSSRPLANWPIRVHQAAYTYLERGTYSSSICRKWKTDKVRRYLLLFALYLSNGNVYYFCLQKLKCKTRGGGGGEDEG